MYIVERVVGVITFSFFLVIVCLVIAKTMINLKGILFFYTVILTILAFYYIPYKTADLYRINETMKLFSSYGFESFYSTYLVESSIPVARLLYWIVGKTGEYALLPAFSTLIYYLCVFRIFIESVELYRFSRTSLSISLFFFMSVGQFMSVISNVRTPLAVSIICCCFFLDCKKGKTSLFHICLYALALMIHNLAALLIGILLLVPVINSRISITKRISLSIVFAIYICVLLLFGGTLLDDIVNKANDYLNGGYSYIWEYLIGIIVLLSAIVVILLGERIRKKGKYNDIKIASAESSTYRFGLILCTAATAISLPIFSVFYRFAAGIVPILMIPEMMLVMEQYDNVRLSGHGTKILSTQAIFLLVSVLLLLLSCTRGSLCSYKFFVI